MRKLVIRLNNWLTLNRIKCVEPARLLLLLPHCLQNSDCDRRLSPEMGQCRACGRCNIGELIQLQDKYGLPCRMARGGREAVGYVRDASIDAVVAVACEKELVEGILACFPKPVMAVINSRPKGPCKDTRIDVPAVERAIRRLLCATPAEAPAPASASATEFAGADSKALDHGARSAPARSAGG